MKKWPGIIAVIALLCGLASGGLGLWLHYRARAQAQASRELQDKSLDAEDKADDLRVRGTPEEDMLLMESRRYGAAASAALDSARRTSKLAVFSGIGSIVLVLASITMIVINLKRKEAEAR